MVPACARHVRADRLAQGQQVTAQRAGVGWDRDLPGALDEGGQHQFGLGRPPSVERGLAGPRGGGHRVDGQPVIAVFLKQLQRHRQQLGLPRRPRSTPRHRRNSGSRGPPWSEGSWCIRVSGIVTREPGKRLSGLPDDGVHVCEEVSGPRFTCPSTRADGAVARISSEPGYVSRQARTTTSVSSRCRRFRSRRPRPLVPEGVRVRGVGTPNQSGMAQLLTLIGPSIRSCRTPCFTA